MESREIWRCSNCGEENPLESTFCKICEEPRPDQALFEAGFKVGKWILKKKLGEGGMAVVYLAEHEELKSPAAVKVLRTELINRPDLFARFKIEAVTASRLNHENIIKVLDFGQKKEIGAYMVLEFLEGTDLNQKLDEAPFEPRFILEIVKQICAGLKAAHNAGIIHRDLKPSNIYLVPREDNPIPLVKLLDFGIAKIKESELLEDQQQSLTKTGTVLGTPYYLAPEQLRSGSKELDLSVDIYALGVITYQMFTAHLPIEENSLAEQMAAILTKKPPRAGHFNPNLKDTAVEIFLDRALSKDPKKRPQNTDEFLKELTLAVEALEDPKKDQLAKEKFYSYYTPAWEELKRERRSKQLKMLAAISFLLILSATAGLFASQYFNKQAPPPPPSPLLKLQEAGTIAFNQKNFAQAFFKWREVLESEEWKKAYASGKWKKQKNVYNPKLYLAASQALMRLQRLTLSIKYLEKYYSIIPDENIKKNLQGMRRELKKIERELREFRKVNQKEFARLRKKQLDALAPLYKSYNQLFKFTDSSNPVYIKTSLEFAENLSTILPTKSIQLLKFLYKNNRGFLSERELHSIKRAIAQIERKLERQKQLASKLIAETLNPEQLPKKILLFEKKIEGTLKKIFKYPDEIKIHLLFIENLEKLLIKDAKKYRFTAIALEKYTDMLSDWFNTPLKLWLKKLIQKNITPEKVLQSIQFIKEYLKLISRQRKVSTLIQTIKIQRAKQLSSEILTQFNTLCQKQKIFRCKNLRKKFSSTRELIERVDKLWRKMQKLAEKDLYLQYQKKAQKLLQLLKENSLSTLLYERKIKLYYQKHFRGARHLTAAKKALKRAKKEKRTQLWWKCHREYRSYLRLFPKSYKKNSVKLEQCKCRCKVIAPFEQCESNCEILYKKIDKTLPPKDANTPKE